MITVIGEHSQVLSTTSLPAAEMDAEPQTQQSSYALNPSGLRTSVPPGVSIRTLVSQLPFDPAHTSIVRVSGVGNSAYLNGPVDLDDPADAGFPFDDGSNPPLFYLRSSGGGATTVNYIRPIRDRGDSVDQVSRSDGGPLVVTVQTTGHLLAPTISANPTHPEAAQHVTFTATPDAPAGSSYQYHWTFGDDMTRTTTTPTTEHAYEAGTWAASVEITSNDDATYGQSPAIVITVGMPVDPPRSATPTAGGGNGSSSQRPSGARNRLPRTSAPDTPSAATTPSSLLRPGAASSGAGATASAARTERPRGRSAATTSAGVTLAAPSGDVVHGFALAAQDGPDAETARGAAGRIDPAEARRPTTSSQLDPTLLGGVVAILLLGLGAFSEIRPTGWRRRRGRRT